MQESSFTSRLGFVLAAAGSAVGLGNIWRFPYLCARYGGGIFLLVYLVLAFTLGFSLLITENAIGRRAGTSVVDAFGALDRKWGWLGWIAGLTPMILLPYYSVIGGWVTKYFADFLTGMGSATAADEYFSSFVSSTIPPLLWLLVFIGAAALVVMMGIQKGVERAARILMPVLFILTIIVATYSVSLPGGLDGVRYIFVPDFEHFSAETVLAAMGMVFYSMSLAAGVMVTYGAYMKKSENLDKAAQQVELLDTAMAVLAALMIIPAVFVFSGGSEDALTVGPSLMFVTMPKVFESMGGIGAWVGTAFFLLVLFAALTSSISLMECVVTITTDKLHVRRVPATLLVTGCMTLIALPSTFGFGIWSNIQWNGMGILDMFDFLTNSVMMPLTALLTTILVGWVVKPKVIVDEVALSSAFRRRKLYSFLVKWVDPFLVGTILISVILQGLGVMPQF